MISPKKTIKIINPYYGKWPVWFPMFLLACGHNPKFQFVIPTDCDIPNKFPKNVQFIKSTLSDFEELASSTLNFPVSLSRPYKMCDFRPAFGLMYKDILRDADFWGHCDLDVIWGDIGKIITDDVLDSNDIISSREDRISGHFTLYRNTPLINNAFRAHPIWEKAMRSDTSYYFDEVGMTEVFKKYRASIEGNPSLNIFWPKYQFNWVDPSSHGHTPAVTPKVLNKWIWQGGKTYQVLNNGELGEVMYLNFMSWKKTLKHCFIDYGETYQKIYLSYSHFGPKETKLPAQIGPIQLYKLIPKQFI